MRGWVYDPDIPQPGVIAEILVHGEIVGSAVASLYRADLEQSGIGSGSHAFIFNFDRELAPADIPNVSVRVPNGQGSFELLPMLPHVEPDPLPAKPLLQFEGKTSDIGQHPVFVLGAARSGTSAMAQALLKLDRFEGHYEGHLLDLMAHLSVAVNKFFTEKTDDIAPGRNTTVSLVPKSCFQDTLDELFVRVTRSIFLEGVWLDKGTPNSNMIYLAPRFRRMWPNSRFISPETQIYRRTQRRRRRSNSRSGGLCNIVRNGHRP